jgi:hypothetical protein
MGYVLVKAEGPGIAATAGSSGGVGLGAILPPISGFKDKFPDEKLREKYGRPVEDEKGKVIGHEYYPGEESIGEEAKRGHNWGNYARYGLTGLAAMNALYNQTSSGQAGVLAPTLGGAYTGFAGSQGLGGMGAELAAWREDKRLQRNSSPNYTEDWKDTQVAEPTQIPEERRLGMGNYTEMKQNPSTGVYEEGAADTALANEYGDPMDPTIESIRRNM